MARAAVSAALLVKRVEERRGSRLIRRLFWGTVRVLLSMYALRRDFRSAVV